QLRCAPSCLPVAHGTGINMDEARARIEAYAAHAERTCNLPDLEHRHAGHADVYGVTVHVLAVAGHAAVDARQPGVGGGRTIGREDLDGAAEADMHLGVPQDVEQQRIHFRLGAFARIAQEVVKFVQGIAAVGAVRPV